MSGSLTCARAFSAIYKRRRRRFPLSVTAPSAAMLQKVAAAALVTTLLARAGRYMPTSACRIYVAIKYEGVNGLFTLPCSDLPGVLHADGLHWRIFPYGHRQRLLRGDRRWTLVSIR